ncbi:YdcH family protein [Pseudomonas sp. N040]|uniref:YdcH family protein n=1 Tax=Pseudomonas sp. N040 TaxID=2785325 RepID=UPI0018A301B9|nr:YdcH family protein [Pseudomonas sp. N040]MBF7730210.1 YdcH family protein [Pseudomonas sp. N040]MBW7013852.1 YdcH family protein [Pseudomonas sp. N040]
MHVDHHPLMTDFPELRETLHNLRQSDQHFARIAGEYEELDKRICRVEDGVELLDENGLNSLKQQRVSLKDDVARMLRKSKGECCGSCGG